MAANSHANSRKLRLSRLWAAAALALMCLSAYFFRPDINALKQAENLNAAFINATTSDGTPLDPMASVAILNDIVRQQNVMLGFWLMVSGGLVLGMALWLGKTPTPRPPLSQGEGEQTPTPNPSPEFRGGEQTPPPNPLPVHGEGEKARIRWRLVAAGVAILLLVGEASADRFGMALPAGMSPHIQFSLFVVGLALVVWGLTTLDLTPRPPLQKREGEKDDEAVGWLRRQMVRTRHAVSLRRIHIRRWHWAQWALLAIVLLAFALRVWGLTSSMRVLVDELHFVSGILEFWKRGDTELMRYINSLSPFARLFTYWQAETVDLLGRNFLGFRAMSALLGTLNVLAVYWLAKALFDRKTALLAALFLATFPAHLHFSRMGIIQIGDPLFGTLALAFLAKAVKPLPPTLYSGDSRRGMMHHALTKPLYWALAGVCLGMTQYFYEGGKLLFPIVAGVWLVGLWLNGRTLTPRPPLPQGEGEQTPPPNPLPVHREGEKYVRRARRSFGWREVAIFVIAALAVALPLYYTIRLTEGPMTGRLTASGLPTDYWATLLLSGVDEGWIQGQLTHATASFLVYVHMPERAVYYGGYHPFVLEWLVPAFLLGVWFVLWKRRGVVLLLWLVFTSLGSSLLVQNAVASRYVVVLPALALLLAVGIRSMWAMLFEGSHQPELNRQDAKDAKKAVSTFLRSQSSVLILLSLLLAAGQALYYFADHLPTFDAQFRKARLYRDVEDAMLRVADFPAGTQAHLIMGEEFDPAYNRDFLKFLTDDVTVETLTRLQVTDEYVEGLESNVHHVFLVEPDDAETLATLRRRFALTEPAFSPYPDVAPDEQFALYDTLGER